MKKIFSIPFFFALLLFLLPLAAQAGDEKTIEMTVVKNDTLINICKKYLDEPSLWPEIAGINHLKNHDLIHQGQRLLIPVRLLKGLPHNGQVVFIKGDVAVRSGQKAEWKKLNVNDLVMQGDILRTGHESVAEIVFDDGTSFFQRPDTILEIRTTQKKADSTLWQRFILRGGQFILKVRRSLGHESRIEIQTPAAVASARGTDFRVAVDAGQNMTSEVLEGKIDVQAQKRVVSLQEGEGTRVNKGEPPLKPRKLLMPPEPSDLQDLYRIMPFSIRFHDVPGAAAYRIGLSADASGKNILREKMIHRGGAFELTGLDDGEYYLHSRSIDDAAIEGFPSEGRKIQVRINPLPPFIQEPANGLEYKGRSVSFLWLKVPQAGHYTLEIAVNPEFKGETIRVNTAETSRQQMLPDFGTYYFRVRSIAPDAFEGIWSDAMKFKLIPPPPPPPLEKPEMNEKELRIRWKDQGANMSYRCQIARDESFLNPVIERQVNQPEILFPKPAEPGVYYVRTSTIDPSGYEGSFSAPQNFEIKSSNGYWVILGAYGLMALLILLLP